MLRKSKKHKTVAEKVAETILQTYNSDSSNESGDELTRAKVIECDDDEYELPQKGTTEFRKLNVKLLSDESEKYKGKIVSRKNLKTSDSEDDEDSENSCYSENAHALFNSLKVNQNRHQAVATDSEEDNEEFEKNDEGEFESGDEEGLEDDENEASESDSADENENEVISNVDHEAEIQKGVCVQNQLHIWERLLELRINLQKVINKANSMPPTQELKELDQVNNKYKDIKETTCRQTSLLLQNLLLLKNNLTFQFSEMAKTTKPTLKRELPLHEQNLGQPPLKKICQYLEEEFEKFRPYRNDVLLKWDDRTKLLQPGVISKKHTYNEEYDIIKKIENALVNKSLQIEKSQLLKNVKQNDATQEYIKNPNVYDDSDFYHQQLRELIEYKANTTSNISEVTKQFFELQKLRQKMKKKVDTKASKGRKLRYIVHNKLVNFMAPNDNTTWTMESVNELSKSLFM